MSDEWQPGEKYQIYLSKIQEILGEEQRTVRDIYYALEARGFPEELAAHGYDFAYRFVKRAVKKGRRNGYIDPEKIVDTSRRAATYQKSSHSSPKSFLRGNVRQIENGYFENFWEDTDEYVEVWLEKAALVSVFEPICEEYNVRLEATRGDWSDSKVFEASKRLRKRLKEDKDVTILYFGDYNPSGLHAPVSVQETLGHYGLPVRDEFHDSKHPDYFDVWPHPEAMSYQSGTLKFERVSLTLEEIERFDLPENPTPSSTDKDRTIRERFMEHASGGRDVNIELNALKEYHRDYLENELRSAIEEHIDEDVREEVEDRVAERQERIAEAIDVDYSQL